MWLVLMGAWNTLFTLRIFTRCISMDRDNLPVTHLRTSIFVETLQRVTSNCHVIAKKVDHIVTIVTLFDLCSWNTLSDAISKTLLCDCSVPWCPILELIRKPVFFKFKTYLSNISLVSASVSHCFALISFQIGDYFHTT